MRRTIGLLAVALLAGCTSYGATNSPVTNENALAVPEVVGRWKSTFDLHPDVGEDEPICIAIEPAGTLTYRGLTGCKAKPNGMIDLQFIRLGGELIAVTQPATSDENLDGDNQVVLLYSFFKVRIQGDSLVATVLDADSLHCLSDRAPERNAIYTARTERPARGEFPRRTSHRHLPPARRLPHRACPRLRALGRGRWRDRVRPGQVAALRSSTRPAARTRSAPRAAWSRRAGRGCRPSPAGR